MWMFQVVLDKDRTAATGARTQTPHIMCKAGASRPCCVLCQMRIEMLCGLRMWCEAVCVRAIARCLVGVPLLVSVRGPKQPNRMLRAAATSQTYPPKTMLLHTIRAFPPHLTAELGCRGHGCGAYTQLKVPQVTSGTRTWQRLSNGSATVCCGGTRALPRPPVAIQSKKRDAVSILSTDEVAGVYSVRSVTNAPAQRATFSLKASAEQAEIFLRSEYHDM